MCIRDRYVTVQCADSKSGVAMGLGHGAYTGNVTRQCFAGIMMETGGVCEPYFECDFACWLLTLAGVAVSCALLAFVVLALAACCIEAGIRSKRVFSPLSRTPARSSGADGGHADVVTGSGGGGGDAVAENEDTTGTTATTTMLGGDEGAASGVDHRDGAPSESKEEVIDVDLRTRKRVHAPIAKVETTYGAGTPDGAPASSPGEGLSLIHI